MRHISQCSLMETAIHLLESGDRAKDNFYKVKLAQPVCVGEEPFFYNNVFSFDMVIGLL